MINTLIISPKLGPTVVAMNNLMCLKDTGTGSETTSSHLLFCSFDSPRNKTIKEATFVHALVFKLRGVDCRIGYT